MKIRLIAITLFLILSAGLYSQTAENQKPPLSQRLFFGGSFGLQFGSVTNIELTPVAGVWLLPRLNVAAGPSFRYYKDRFDETLIYGGRTYTQIFIIQDFNNIIPAGVHFGLFLHGEYEGLSLEKSFFEYDSASHGRAYQGTFLAGAGLSQPIGQRSAAEFVVLWTISNPKYQIYGTPEIKISFIF